MIGDPSDMLSRLKSALPSRWFADATPVLDGLLAGLAASGPWVFSLVQTAKSQTRIATATGGFLDMIAQDFLGGRLPRRAAQGDAAYRARILSELLRARGTRASVVSVLQDLTGRTPAMFEPQRPDDTGAWGQAAGYGVAGGWGSLLLPYQVFVRAYRPRGAGIATVSGWGAAAGGYGAGAIEYASLDQLAGEVTDADIMAAVAGVMPAASIAWTQIAS